MPIIINGGSYRAGGWWGKHLQNGEKNERVQLVEMTGLTAETVPAAFREMEGIAAGTKCRNYFYQANINPREDERLTPKQWQEAVDTLEKNLGLTGQPRFVIEHEKKGRVHQHVVWSRIDADRMVAISDSLTAAIHERTSRELEIKFDLERGRSILTPNRDFERPDRRPQKDETFRTLESGIDPATVKAALKSLWQHADNGQSFKAALESEGYVLARGDRRDFVVIDRAGDDHSLARRLGIKAADVRERMADTDRTALPSVAEAKVQQRDRQAERGPQQIQPEQTAEPQVGARSRYDRLRETEREVARGQFPGKYDELRAAEPSPEVTREFASNANRTAEPAAPIFDRDAANAEWDAKVTEAAIAGTPANQNTHEPVSLEAMQADPWKAVYAALPDNADRTLLAATALVAGQCEKYALAAARVHDVILPELAGYYRDRQTEAGERRDEARQRLAALPLEQASDVSPLLLPEKVYDAACDQLETEIWRLKKSGGAEITAERMDANPWSLVFDRGIPEGASDDLLLRINAVGYQLNHEAWERRDEASLTHEESMLWNEYGQMVREVAHDAAFELSMRRQRTEGAWEQPLPVEETPARDMLDAAEDTLDSASRTTGKMFSGLISVADKVLGGILSFFGGGDTKLSPQQAERAARSREEQAEANAQAAAEQEQQAARDRVVTEQDRQQQQVDLSRYIRTGRPPVREANAGRENEDDLDQGRERER